MTAPTLHIVESEEPETVASPSRRVWKRANPFQGSTRLSLKAMGILYDAGQPLTREDLAQRVMAQLDVYEGSYLEAWYRRRREQLIHANRKKRGGDIVSEPLPAISTDLLGSVRTWLSLVFLPRVTKGHTLVRDPDGRYRPGPKAPRVLTLDGRLIAFTPEARRELAQAEHDQGRAHLALVEWARLTKTLDLTTPEARAQLLIVAIGRLLVGANKGKAKRPFDERTVSPLFDNLVRLADTATVQRTILQEALNALWPVT